MPRPSITPGAPFRWLADAFALLRAHPRVLLSAGMLMLASVLAVTFAQMALERVLPASLWLRAGSQMLLSVALMAPVLGGFYRLVARLQAGHPARAGELFAPFGDTAAMARLVGVQVLFFVLTLLLLILPAFVFGGDSLRGFVEALSALAPGDKLPALPRGLLPILAGLIPLGLLLFTARELALAQAALAERAPLAAAGDGLRVVLANAGSLLLFYLPLAGLALLALLVFGLVLALVGMVLNLISPALATAAVLPLVLLGVLAFYPLMFAFFLFGWRQVLGDDEHSAAPPPTTHQIEA